MTKSEDKGVSHGPSPLMKRTLRAGRNTSSPYRRSLRELKTSKTTSMPSITRPISRQGLIERTRGPAPVPLTSSWTRPRRSSLSKSWRFAARKHPWKYMAWSRRFATLCKSQAKSASANVAIASSWLTHWTCPKSLSFVTSLTKLNHYIELLAVMTVRTLCSSCVSWFSGSKITVKTLLICFKLRSRISTPSSLNLLLFKDQSTLPKWGRFL